MEEEEEHEEEEKEKQVREEEEDHYLQLTRILKEMQATPNGTNRVQIPKNIICFLLQNSKIIQIFQKKGVFVFQFKLFAKKSSDC